MFGIGDCLHQRAVLRRLLEHYDVWLETCHIWQHLDLLEHGNLHLILRPTRLWMHEQNIAKERGRYPDVYCPARQIPRGAHQIRNWYLKKEIDRTGSILGAMFLAAGLEYGIPDFSLPIRPEWRTSRVLNVIEMARASGRPMMIYRPIVLRKEWNSASRNPDPQCYEQIYAASRKHFFTVSIASLRTNVEWIVGPEQPADLKLHGGQFEMWELAALFAEASVVFCNAGMAPVLAQAVGTPSIVIYGGRESFRTTQRAGAHLAPTLGIDTVDPCDCHTNLHNCNKQVDVPSAVTRIEEFIDAHVAVRDDLRRHARQDGDAEAVDQAVDA